MNQDELLLAVRKFKELLHSDDVTDQQRADALYSLDICHYCGDRKEGRFCQCMNDE